MFRPHGGIIAPIFLISSHKMQRTSEDTVGLLSNEVGKAAEL